MFRNLFAKSIKHGNYHQHKRHFLTKNYAFHWKVDKIAATALLPAIPIAWFFKTKVTDSVVAALTCFHMHHGLSQISTDYLRRMPRVRKYFVLKFSFMVFNGMLFNIVLRDCGFMLTIHKILNLKPARFTDDFPLSYEYAEDAQIPEMIVDGQQQQCDCREVICRHFKEADFQERLETFCSCHYGD